MKNHEKEFLKIIDAKRKNINKLKISMKDIGGKGYHIFICEDFTTMQQHNSEEKYFVLERLKRYKIKGVISNKKLKEGDIEYRIFYFIWGKVGLKKDTWIRSKNCALIPEGDLLKLIKKGKEEKVINTLF